MEIKSIYKALSSDDLLEKFMSGFQDGFIQNRNENLNVKIWKLYARKLALSIYI